MSAFVPTNRIDWPAQTTTDSYADLGKPWKLDEPATKSKTLVIENTGAANGAHYKILGSVDDGVTYAVEIAAETALAAGTKATRIVNDYYTHLKVQVKAQVAGSQTTVKAAGCGIAL